MTYAADGTTLYTVDPSDKISFWNGTDLTSLSTQSGDPYGSVAAVAVDPTGTLVATASHDGSRGSGMPRPERC